MIQSREITAYSESRCCNKLIPPFTLLSFKSQLPVDLLFPTGHLLFVHNQQDLNTKSRFIPLFLLWLVTMLGAVGEFQIQILLLPTETALLETYDFKSQPTKCSNSCKLPAGLRGC